MTKPNFNHNSIGYAAEDTFHDHLKDKAIRTGILQFRLNDAKALGAANSNQPRRYRGKVHPSPSDFLVIDPRPGSAVTIFYEVKATSNKNGIPFDNFDSGQLKVADAFDGNMLIRGGAYYFVILNANTNQWYLVPGNIVPERYRESKGFGFIPWGEIIDYQFDLTTI